MEDTSEFIGIKLFVALNWFVSDFISTTEKYVLIGDTKKIMAAYQAAFMGQKLIASIRK